jgi:endonuclease G
MEEEQKAATICPFGMPEKKPGWDHGYTEYVVHDGYALEHSGDYKIPLWVCERLDAHPSTHFQRADHFRPDPLLDGPKSQLSDYRHSGYARGHQAPAEDFAWNETLLDESFYLSNMAPQIGPFNSGVWAKLEKDARGWAEAGHPTWIITGPMLYDPAEDNASTADGWIHYFTIGADVVVPTHFYKIIVRQNDSGGVQAAAFVIKNEKPIQPYAMSDFLRPIQWVEDRTGFDFMPELEPGQAQLLESAAGDIWP